MTVKRDLWVLFNFVIHLRMKSVGAFDLFGIRQGCWQECEADKGAFNDGTTLPLYRDPNTNGQFQDVGKFFICVDVCEGGYVVNRVAFILPMVLMGLIVFIIALSCCCCKKCYFYKYFKGRQKTSALLSANSNSSSLHLAKSEIPPVDHPEQIRKSWGGLYIVSGKMSSKVGDVNNTQGSSSINSWVTDEDSDHGKTIRKGSKLDDLDEKKTRLQETAKKLGKRLIEMDKKAEEKAKEKEAKLRQRSFNHGSNYKKKENKSGFKPDL